MLASLGPYADGAQTYFAHHCGDCQQSPGKLADRYIMNNTIMSHL